MLEIIALSELERVIKQIRQQWKNVEILVRGDSAYSREDIMTWCESQTGVDYVFGLAQNSRLMLKLGLFVPSY